MEAANSQSDTRNGGGTVTHELVNGRWKIRAQMSPDSVVYYSLLDWKQNNLLLRNLHFVACAFLHMDAEYMHWR